MKVKLLSLSCLGVLALSSQAAVILSATEDNNVLWSAPNTVQQSSGSADALQLKGPYSSQGNTRTAYLKFALPTSGTAGLNQARLSLTVSSNPTTTFDVRIYALNTGVAGSNWAENTITWNNSPGLGTGPGNLYGLDPAKVTALGDFSQITSGTNLGDTRSLLFSDWENYRQADDAITLIAVVTGQGSATPGLNFASSEHATLEGPTLELIPEPSAAMLALCSLSGLLRRRR
ncbi:MAG: DNRLRE domain-containing protein [Verrucomicrobiales bacterium]